MSLLFNIEEAILLKTTRNLLVIEAIEVRDNDGSIYFNCVLLHNKGGKISIISSISYVSVADLRGWMKKNQPPKCSVILGFNSDKIIHKIAQDDLDHADALKFAIPNAELENFYCQIFQLADKRMVISVVRKQLIDRLLNILSGIQDHVILVSIGPFFILESYQYLFRKNDLGEYHIEFDNYRFLLQNDYLSEYKITPYAPRENPELIGVTGEKIKSSLLLSYSLGLHYFLHPNSTTCLDISSIKQNNRERIFRSVSRVFCAAVLIVTLIALAISSVLYSSYRSKYTELEDQVSTNQTLWNEYQAKRKKEEKKLELLKDNGIASSSNIAYYADQITFAIPESLYIRKMEIHPMNTKSNESYDFATNRILIEGNCNSPNLLNDWVADLKSRKWVRTIIIKDFKQMDDLSTFVVEITKDYENFL